MTPAFAMASATACINWILCSPGISASSISAITGLFLISVVGILWYWVSRFKSVVVDVSLLLLSLVIVVPATQETMGDQVIHPLHVPLTMGVQVVAAIRLPLHPTTGVLFSSLLLFHLLLHLLLEWLRSVVPHYVLMEVAFSVLCRLLCGDVVWFMEGSRGDLSSWFTSQWRVLDGACPSRDLVNDVELVHGCLATYGAALLFVVWAGSSGVPVIDATM
uniref:Uncharacterized protein n=1 Tax=Populus alba TaxID=43335 RepID=A0A4U5QR58_POPAL|nr:hypothetical protein D5086_0000059150 [Populus alba]